MVNLTDKKANIPNKPVPFDDFFDCYKDSIGVEGAFSLIKKALSEEGLDYQKEYSQEDAIKICNALKKNKGFISIAASLLASRIYLRNI